MASVDDRPTVLVVDDESVIAQLVADILGGEGYEVDIARHGAAALERLSERRYDLVLSDLRMPELDGIGLFRAVEERFPALLGRFVFITGTSEHADYRDLIEALSVPILTKPFDMVELQRLVRDVLAGSPR
jgi:CheY-like chemotaxis protein